MGRNKKEPLPFRVGMRGASPPPTFDEMVDAMLQKPPTKGARKKAKPARKGKK